MPNTLDIPERLRNLVRECVKTGLAMQTRLECSEWLSAQQMADALDEYSKTLRRIAKHKVSRRVGAAP